MAPVLTRWPGAITRAWTRVRRWRRRRTLIRPTKQVGRPAQGEVGVDPPLQDAQPVPGQPARLVPDETRTVETGERVAVPEPQRLAEPGGGAGRVAQRGRPPAALGEVFEPGGVEFGAVDA